MTTVTHELIINVETGAYTSSPPLNINQGDNNSHIIVIKLRNSEDQFVSISGTAKPKITFKDSEDITVVTSAVTVVNAYRGILSYTVGPTLVKNYGRYTAYLDISECQSPCICGLSVSFVLNIIKVNTYCSSDVETTITQEFYNEIVDHLDNKDIHLDYERQEFLNKFIPVSDELYDLATTDLEELVKEEIVEQSGGLLRRAFITLDTKSQMLAYPEDQLCDGKMFRINYPLHDGDPSTIEHPAAGQPEPLPEYWVAIYHGTPGDGGHYEFHEAYGFNPSDLAYLREQVQGLRTDVDDLELSVSGIDGRLSTLETTVANVAVWKVFE